MFKKCLIGFGLFCVGFTVKNNEITGNWISLNERSVCTYVQGERPVIALENELINSNGHEFAIYLDENGVPYMQIANKKESHIINLLELARNVDK